ncbi:MAG: heterodisulfide reductase-related iron-sulfur binding cluster [Pseudomonadota bacterium]
MDLCLACKACKTECPTGVDMGRLKAEWLAQRNLRKGVSRRARFVADLPQRLAVARRFPAFANLIGQSRPIRAALEYLYGLDRRVPPPRLARRTFRAWFDRHERAMKGHVASRGPVVYFIDTWTNYFVPQVGIAAVTLLERAGFRVRCPQTVCCGRPAISHGLLGEARQLATVNVRRLAQYASAGIPILGTEPSCVSALVDEYPQLLRSGAARRVAAGTLLIDTFLRQLLDRSEDALEFQSERHPLCYHAHCHQEALVGSSDAVALMQRVWGDQATKINSGCCGMAGTFGHEAEHYDVARAIGEQRLFPAVRERGDARIAVSGFSCRTHIEHHTDARAKHLVEYLAEALTAPHGR